MFKERLYKYSEKELILIELSLIKDFLIKFRILLKKMNNI